MTPEQIEEARRWVALRGWRWMPGMRSHYGWRVFEAMSQRGWTAGAFETGDEVKWCPDAEDEVPDVTDPATRGCLLALAREITGRPCRGATETQALLAACEAHEREAAP